MERHIVGRLVNGKLERMCKKAVVAHSAICLKRTHKAADTSFTVAGLRVKNFKSKFRTRESVPLPDGSFIFGILKWQKLLIC